MIEVEHPARLGPILGVQLPKFLARALSDGDGCRSLKRPSNARSAFNLASVSMSSFPVHVSRDITFPEHKNEVRACHALRRYDILPLNSSLCWLIKLRNTFVVTVSI